MTAPAGTPAAASQIEQLLRDQLQAMNQLFVQQLAALQNMLLKLTTFV